MEPEIVKRNYLFFILGLLKERTAEDGDHLTAEQITAEIKSQYGLEPNRKTIYTVISDLTAMGFDVHLVKNGKKPGYYLGKRELSDTEMNLLIDGIESLDNLTADEKTDIYDKICKILGYPSSKVDNYLYARKQMTNEWLGEEDDDDLFPKTVPTMDKLDLIHKAIRTNKQLGLYVFLPPLTAFFMEEMDEETAKRYRDSCLSCHYPVSPYKVFRNKDNELCLLFCISFEGKIYPGFIRITSIDDVNLRPEKRIEVDEATMFPDDLANYEDAREYLAKQQLCVADLIGRGMPLSAMLFELITDDCVEHKEIIRDGQSALHITYRLGKEKEIEELILESLPRIVPLPGSRIYDHLQKLWIGLNAIFA